MNILAITRKPSPLLESGERTHIGREAIDYARALAQHDAYRAALTALGASVTRLDDGDAFPDGVFVEDTALVLDEVAILMRPGAESRRGEVTGVAAALAAHRELVSIEAPATIDGGDIVAAGRRILVGRSARTNQAGIDALRALVAGFGYSVEGVRMHGCLHLKSGCTTLPDGRLLVNRAWIDTSDLDGFASVDVPRDEPWGGDVAIVNGTVMAADAYPRTIEVLKLEGYDVMPVDVSEFAKAEGGVTCLSLVFVNRGSGFVDRESAAPRAALSIRS
ncbi:MAG TPA: N(G),N(G)-dimethylarginine dimethylaminohydrolase [Gemmatimonadaceae bacterium]|nr:N(G),N(G)-dimethylarginine dimethylaminohydrolase [Gemmatimonadaceae bacterium]